MILKQIYVLVVQEVLRKKKFGNFQKLQMNGKKNNLIALQSRMKESQLMTFKKSYDEKIKFGKLVYSKNLKNKPQT